MTYTTHSADETRALAAEIGATLRRGDVVVLNGELGAGKTTFVKGLAEGLGVVDAVTSPTFTIVQHYEGRLPVTHVDVYRLDRLQELHDLGFEEMLEDGVTIIEWGDAVAPLLPRKRLEVRLTMGDDLETRTIEIAPR
jgi:tRNA threonylcarbamoyladenosine biosynthesis protein TsaE